MYVDNTLESPAVLSLCTGMRGLERGIERAIGPVRTVAYVEIEAFVIENLVQQMEQGVLVPAPVWSNLKTFPSEQFHGKIHGITGGYPCQPFSVAGKRGGGEDPRHLWPYIKSMVGTIRPVWCFFENVPGHLTLGYREVRSDLEQLGYTVEEGIFSAEEVGAPHQRKRLFILAVDNTTGRKNYFGESRELAEKKGRWEGKHTTTSGTSHVDYPNSERQQSINEIRTRRNSIEHASEGELADPTSERLQKPGQTGIGELSKESREGIHDRLEQSGDELADPSELGMEGNRPEGEQVTEVQTGEALSGCDRGRDRWPASPGEQQYEWEAPRIESSVGFTVNGHNFREDLLRMAGNGVVEQTAELAWITLWNKFK